MKLRSFQLSDVHDVLQIWQETAIYECEKETLTVLSEQLAIDRDLVLVAELENGRVVGAIVGTKDGECGFFYCLAVNPEFQKKKIGTKLVQALEERFVKKGVKRTWITVDEGTEKLLPFYKYLGYTNSCSTRLEKDLLTMEDRLIV
ncbi:GNAT family N-acetyltransferase [Hazenella sp. IB182357]|uniref:GNAT family N-acetyltransferase n=1 Tax=Polycladospora coralii TaxID=2771432 RepID=A0A926NCN1_9BACL|nr:GNAT family N-acetyltransferase [Polycladospora coralii]MBD1373375.1 GNAT family N-acetyltransferase [Polycladospora coralii]MBS7531627.1 GNAT family N-acetyltransferase [Polycladospora coralii]